MREETELKWAFNLISANEISNTFFVKNDGTYNLFEKYAEAGIRNESFRKWFNQMIKFKIIEFTGYNKNSKGKDSEVFTLNRIKLLDYLKDNNKLYSKSYGAVILHFKAMR
jgi:hypothetical protein